MSGDHEKAVPAKSRETEYKYHILLALFLSFTIFFFGPTEIYFTIYQDVWFDLMHIIGLIALMFAGAFAGVSVFLFLVDHFFPKVYPQIAALLFGIVTAAYVQGNFLPASLGTMDGTQMKWSFFSAENMLSLVLWLAVVGGSLCLLHFGGVQKLKACSRVIMICILLVQAVTLCTLCFTTDGLKKKTVSAYTQKNKFVQSGEKNFIILMLDAYDSQIFRAIYEGEDSGQYLEMLDGFTYYPDALGMYSRTAFALPHILSGKRHTEFDQVQYANEAYLESPLLKRLIHENYKINIYSNDAIPTEKAAYEMTENYLREEDAHLGITSKSKMISYLCKLIGIRYLPQPLKQYCWFYSEDLEYLKDLGSGDVMINNISNYTFDSEIGGMTASAEDKMFDLYHLSGVHPPCYFDENLNRTSKDLAAVDNLENAVRNGKGVLLVVNHFLNKVKELGIYDNCAIIIMADHGGRLYVKEELSRSNPLLLIKGFGERHPLAVSDNAVSYEDLQDVFARLLDGETGEAVFPAFYTHERTRYFFDTYEPRMFYTNQHAFEWQKLQRLK